MTKRQDAIEMISDLISMETNRRIISAYTAAREFAQAKYYQQAALIMTALGHNAIADMIWEG